MQHHQYQDAPRSGASHIQNLQDKVPTFKNKKPEEFLHKMKYFKTITDGTRTMSAAGKPQFLCTMLRGKSPIKIGILASQVGSTTNGRIKLFKESLIVYFPPINSLNNKKHSMIRAIPNLDISNSRYFRTMNGTE